MNRYWAVIAGVVFAGTLQAAEITVMSGGAIEPGAGETVSDAKFMTLCLLRNGPLRKCDRARPQ